MNTNKPTSFPLRNTGRFILLLALPFFLAACEPENESGATESTESRKQEETAPPSKAELSILRQQIEDERKRRSQAEIKVSAETSRREFWETLTVFAFMLAVALFLVGTAIGSKGRQHAESL